MRESVNRYNFESYADQSESHGGVAIEEGIPLSSFTLFGYDTMVAIDAVTPLYGWDNPASPLDGSQANEGALLCMAISNTSDQGAHFDHQTSLPGHFVGGGDQKTLTEPMLMVGIKHRVYYSSGGAVVPLSKVWATFHDDEAAPFTVTTTAALSDATTSATNLSTFYWTWHNIGGALTDAQRRNVKGGTTFRLRLGLNESTDLNGYYQILGVRLRYRVHITLPVVEDRKHRYQ